MQVDFGLWMNIFQSFSIILNYLVYFKNRERILSVD